MDQIGIEPQLLSQLETMARQVSKNAYCPYSHFAVGAAVLTTSGKIYLGCNVENAAIGPSNCAERTAIFSAVAQGEHGIRAVVIYTPTPEVAAPCGVCRQVINEFNSDCLIVCVCDSEQRLTATLPELLPKAFGPANLGK